MSITQKKIMKLKSTIYSIALITLFQFVMASCSCYSQNDNISHVTVYPNPQKEGAFSKLSPYFEIRVFENENDKVGKTSYVYFSPDNEDKDRMRLDAKTRRTFNFSVFSFSAPIIIEVTKLGSSASSAIVRPSRLGIGTFATTSVGNGSKIRFPLAKPCKISIEFNDDPTLSKQLMLFADTPENAEDILTPNAPSVFVVDNDNALLHLPPDTKNVLFAPKILKIGYWEIPKSVEHIYIPGGAWVRGYFSAKREGGHPIKINGRGVLTGDVYQFHYPDTADKKNDIDISPWYPAIKITGDPGNSIEGLTLTDASAINIAVYAKNCTIKNVNIHGFHFNNDAITESGDCIIDNCFIQDEEDAIIIYGDNHKISNCTFWQLNNACIQFGWWPHNMGGNNIIDNCDVIHADWVSDDYKNQGFINAMNLTNPTDSKQSVDNHKASTTQNFSVTSIFFDCPIKRFLDIRKRRWRPQTNYKNVSQYWSYKNFTFDNLHFKGPVTDPLIVLQSDNDHNVSQFKFGQIFLNGKKVEKQDYLNSKIFNGEAFGIITK